MSAYTLCGFIAAGCVGATLAKVGRVLVPPEVARIVLLLAIPFLGGLFAAREAGWVHFRVAERRAQTDGRWFREFGILPAAAMWGFHIGLAFMTRITYMGFWLLVAIISVVGSVRLGVLTMLSYWLGRVLSVWLAPLLTSWHANNMGTAAMSSAAAGRSAYKRIQVLGNLCGGVLAFVLGLHWPL